MASLAEIRNRIAAQENKTQKGQITTDNSIFPHWNAEEGTITTVRFLPDADSNNTFFWVERQIIRLPFNGVKGDPNVKQIQVQVPCAEMYGDTCPVLTEVRPWYKDETLKEMANKYWKKRSYLFQAFVRQNPIGEDKTPSNPIRRLVISPQIFTIIKSSLMDPEMEELPTDYVRGLDFNIKKTSKGGYADYSTSNWARKESPLTETEQAALEAHGLFNLADFLPKRPTEAELKIIKEMFEASVEGEPYDTDRWGQYYRPYGVDAPQQTGDSDIESTSKKVSVPVTKKEPVVKEQVQEETAPWKEEDEDTSSSEPVSVPKNKASSTEKAQDILAIIRARQNKTA